MLVPFPSIDPYKLVFYPITLVRTNQFLRALAEGQGRCLRQPRTFRMRSLRSMIICSIPQRDTRQSNVAIGKSPYKWFQWRFSSLGKSLVNLSTLDESTVNPKGIFSWIVPFKYQILTRGEYPPNKSMVFICIHGVVSPLTPLKTTGWDDGSLHQPEPPDITARGGGVETGASR